MSFYAKSKGSITLDDRYCCKPWFVGLYPEGDCVCNVDHDSEGNLVIDVDYYGDYDEMKYYDFFARITEYTKSGCLNFVGEDNSLWRFIFKDGKWKEENGSISFVNASEEMSAPESKQQYAATFVYEDQVVTYLFFDFKEAVHFVRDTLSLEEEGAKKSGYNVTIGETSYADSVCFCYNADEEIRAYVSKVYD